MAIDSPGTAMMRNHPRWRRYVLAAALAVVAAGALVGPGSAEAAVYTVHSCKRPDGLPAGLGGWSRAFVGQNEESANYCGRGSYWILFMRGVSSHPSGDSNEAVFTAPSGTTISSYEIWRAARVMKSSAFNYSYALMEGQHTRVIERCDGSKGCWYRGSSRNPDADINRVARSGLQDVKRIWLSLACRSTTTCAKLTTDSPAKLWLHRATITLEDTSSPVIASPPSGTLVNSSGRLTGVEQVSISATDSGGGVYEGMVEVDGRVIARQILDSNGGRCQRPFTDAAPCKRSASNTVPVDTRGLADGAHSLRLLVTDATGANTAVWGPMRIRTSNGSCNPTPRAGGFRLRAAVLRRKGRRLVRTRSVTTRYGRRVALSARLLTPTGAPVAGAPVCVTWRARAANTKRRGNRVLLTDSNGRIAYRLPGGPSRVVYFVHRTPAGAVARSVRVNVRAPVRLAASRRSLRNGETLALSGRLPGRPRPRAGVLVELQAGRTGGWQTFATTRSRRGGSFNFGYTFTRTTGVETYALRAKVPRQAAYPYARGASRPIHVRVAG
jgi:hypothetical protein